MEQISEYILYIDSGMVLTLKLLAGGLLTGLVLGTVLAILRYNGIGKGLITQFISVIRGTPVILQLSFVYFSIPGLTGFRPDILAAGILTFGLNSSAYIAEILRAGIEHLPKGQFEAAATLNVSNFYLWKDIILPQVINNILPALINETIALTKETALISTIGGMDLMRKAQSAASEHFTYFLPLCIAGCYYYALVLLIEFLGKRIAKGGSHVNNC
ncbi:amino acid ABC transporter permease [Legionella bononiensis]|uniref:Amino acid ABC transporter permease n=1 Tax=Legionella bononiensis TaxID=2793102 RepID=A0ABS1WDP6_9GAMM|nr:amino acid ABC transporter permease [Legionella bononiensis]MBL7481459.1 amino acid ABC transporter permease [Legionella bononiensis]MBL7527491.1 amino acid ABC transporter permease [Legionella bononiensis]